MWATRGGFLAPTETKKLQKNIYIGRGEERKKLLLTLREMPINPFLWHTENAREAYEGARKIGGAGRGG